MANTYTLISSNVLSSSAASVTFSAIPATFTDLVLKVNARGSDTGNYLSIQLRFNGDTATNYSRTAIYGYSPGGSFGSARGSSLSATTAMMSSNADSATANTFGASVIDVLDYASTTKNKTMRAMGGFDANGRGYFSLASSLGVGTSAINSITIGLDSNQWGQYSHLALYGIKG
jgi:hypothetical protein